MKILVTGGAGFIGSNLCDYLVNNNHKVIVIDDLSTGHHSNLSLIMDSITFFNEKVEYFDYECLSKINAIVHLAAQPSVPFSISDFGNSSSANVLGTIRLINYCRIKRIPLVYASSSAIYGDLEMGDDTSTKIDLLSPYATDKYVMELYAKTAYKLYQFSSIGLRFFNVYGPRQDPISPYSGVISTFINRLLREDSLVINGGYQTRDFIYVKDVVDIIYRSVVLSSKSDICEQINVLTGKTTTIDKLADKLMKETKISVDKNYNLLPVGDPEKSNGTTEKMVELLNVDLRQMVSLEEGLVETVKFINNNS